MSDISLNQGEATGVWIPGSRMCQGDLSRPVVGDSALLVSTEGVPVFLGDKDMSVPTCTSTEDCIGVQLC